MKPALILGSLALAGILLTAQTQRPARTGFEVMSVFPRETSPGQYAQADANQLQALAADGWELVSAVPFVYRNEEHNNGTMNGPKPVVTQVYPAYVFKRARLNR
jgi:hypothetical protein